MARDTIKEWRRRVYQVLEQGPVGNRASVVVDRFLVALFAAIELISLAVFTAEYLLRLWCGVEHGPHRHLSAAGIEAALGG